MFQQVMLVGNLGADPEMRYTASGVPVTSFRIAVNKRWTGQDGQRQEKTTWFRVSAWRRQAEIVSQYATKGSQVLVIGEIEEPNTWTDREGNFRASLEVTARTVQFVGGRGDASAGGYGGSERADASESGDGSGGESPTDEDIPF